MILGLCPRKYRYIKAIARLPVICFCCYLKCFNIINTSLPLNAVKIRQMLPWLARFELHVDKKKRKCKCSGNENLDFVLIEQWGSCRCVLSLYLNLLAISIQYNFNILDRKKVFTSYTSLRDLMDFFVVFFILFS